MTWRITYEAGHKDGSGIGLYCTVEVEADGWEEAKMRGGMARAELCRWPEWVQYRAFPHQWGHHGLTPNLEWRFHSSKGGEK